MRHKYRLSNTQKYMVKELIDNSIAEIKKELSPNGPQPFFLLLDLADLEDIKYKLDRQPTLNCDKIDAPYILNFKEVKR